MLVYIKENHSGSNFIEIEKQKIRNFVIDLLGNDPANSLRDIVNNDNYSSLRTISDRLNISRPTLRKYISSWLELIYNKKDVENVIRLIWPSKSAKQKEKLVFYEVIEKYLRLFPERVHLIPSRNALLKGDLHGIVSKNTFKPWSIEYIKLFKNRSKSASQETYDEIWGRNCATRRKIEYKDIFKFVHQRSHGTAQILTPNSKFDLNNENPTDRNVKIICGKDHVFSIKVRKLIYDYNWCPLCNESFCELIMRNYLTQLFNSQFKTQVSLEKALGIDRGKIILQTMILSEKKYCISVHVGQLRYDHFNNSVCILGNDGVEYHFKIAGEYDGIQHDEENIKLNPFCSNHEDFAAIKARDLVKNRVSSENNIIMIRLKEKDGFSRRKLLKKQKEVIKEISSQFNSQIQEKFGSQNIYLKYDPLVRYDPLGKKEPYRIRDSLDNFLFK